MLKVPQTEWKEVSIVTNVNKRLAALIVQGGIADPISFSSNAMSTVSKQDFPPPVAVSGERILPGREEFSILSFKASLQQGSQIVKMWFDPRMLCVKKIESRTEYNSGQSTSE